MTFDELLRAARGSEELTMPESWSQGRATFGGLTAALMFERMEKLVAEGRAMRSLQVSFVGPVEPEVPASFEAEILREGKAVSQVQGRIVQKGETRLVCLASFGGDRDSQESRIGLSVVLQVGVDARLGGQQTELAEDGPVEGVAIPRRATPTPS